MQKPEIKLSPYLIGTMRLGKWGLNFSTSQWQAFIEECLQLGLKDFDHADIYGNYTTEEDFGKVLKNKSSLRQKMQITTKCGIRQAADNRPNNKLKSYDSSRKHIIQSVENSLAALSTDYLDVLLIHRPDFLMNPLELAETFGELQLAGKVKYFGVSNFSASQFNLINSSFPLVTNQIEVSLNHLQALEDGTLDQLLQQGITPTAWSPLGVSKSLLPPTSEKESILQTTLDKIANKYGINTAQLFLAWLKRHPAGIVPVLGTSKIERVKEALAIKEIKLDSEDWYELYTASKGINLP
ncbi:aldo/keto reductase [Marivirga sp. S37H4]|uniref:Aldo/keto reductase n=1 Tax=Marivirga aurantiaca TaxID=2802615 RepID=A0A935CAN9_9BACT|nr:aldo/keto reductase [Marivirga aurantiaca]MBK6266307.1 aldo/keto reductase [Marivirga aurantiaca]